MLIIMRAENDNFTAFNIAAINGGFTANEKTLLGDIAMDFRDIGINTRLQVTNSVNIPAIKFYSLDDKNSLYLFVTRHSDGGVVSYQISPRQNYSETYINFADVLVSCRNHIEAFNRKPAAVLPFKMI